MKLIYMNTPSALEAVSEFPLEKVVDALEAMAIQ